MTDAIIDKTPDAQATEAAFTVTSMILHGLRSKLRTVVAAEFLSHPAYADDNFPIWWQHQNNEQFIIKAKPPFFVRYSHHPSNPFQGVLKGLTSIQCYAQTQPWVEAIRDIVLGAYPEGETIYQNGFEVTFREHDARGAWPIKGWDRTKPWPERAEFMIPVSIGWRISLS
ncbi:hypothetical protein D3C72_377360 [compost metagenome]